MRSLLKWIPATCVLSLLVAVDRPAPAQQLQWQHASQQRQRPAARPTQPTAKPTAAVDQVRRTAAKQPAAQLPTRFKQPSADKPIATADTAPVRRPPARSAAEQATRISDRAVRPAMQQHRRLAQRPDDVVDGETILEELPPGEEMGPAMGPVEAPPCDCPDCTYGGPVYGEVVEPGCGVGYYGEPVCAAPGACEVGCGVPFGGIGCGEAGCVDCGDQVVGGPAGGCGECGCGGSPYWPQSLFGCGQRGCIPILWVPPIREVVMFGGVQGFKGPLDVGRDGGNFGFQEGFNLGGPMAWLPWPGLGYQVGYRATHSQLSGDSNTGTDDAHSQHFLTTGLFKRRPVGWQYGVVWDMLRDERQGAHDFGQIRGELGFKNVAHREFGFSFATNSNDNVLDDGTFHAAEQYLFYYRINGREGGEFRGFAGFTGDSNGVLGSEFQTPLTDRWSLQGNWRYLIPEGGNEGSGAREEGWNVGLQLVWHFGLRAKSWHTRPFRPMFDVADNASLIVVD